MWAEIEGTPGLKAAEIARKTYGSFATDVARKAGLVSLGLGQRLIVTGEVAEPPARLDQAQPVHQRWYPRSLIREVGLQPERSG
jgi:hypothetical protein